MRAAKMIDSLNIDPRMVLKKRPNRGWSRAYFASVLVRCKVRLVAGVIGKEKWLLPTTFRLSKTSFELGFGQSKSSRMKSEV
jgi:hypothetical protein